jgi:hypothetical protein
MKFLNKIISISCAFIVSATYLCTSISTAEICQEASRLTSASVCKLISDGMWFPIDEDIMSCCSNTSLTALLHEDVPRTLPTSVDNSNSIYFPPTIGYQGNINSCAAWATTYYQFTYEVNRLRGIQTNNSNTYSPTWTYNYINGGNNQFTHIGDAYQILQYHGAMKLADLPYDSNASTYNYNWPTTSDLDKMATALSYRVEPTCIKSSSTSNITNIKNDLANGRIATVWTNPDGWVYCSYNNEKYVLRGSNVPGGHYMTVVGYDDNRSVTFYNGSNGVTTTMTGAFKVVDSMGLCHNNKGYVWVAYDALNDVSSYTNGWETGIPLGERQPIFKCDNNNNNGFIFVEAKHYKSYLIGRVEYSTTDPWNTNIYGSTSDLINSTGDSKRFIPLYFAYNNGLSNIPDLMSSEYKVMLFDYFNDTNPSIGNYLSSSFSTKLTNSTSNYTYPIRISIIDNLCQDITTVDTSYNTSSLSQYLKTFTLNLAKGRITHYDSNPINSNDVGLLASYLLGNSQLSSLQWYLADMDNDSTVDSIDLALMQQAVGRQNNSDNVLDVFIPELNATIREYILNQNDMETLTRVENALAS